MNESATKLYELSFLLQKEEDATEVADLLKEHSGKVVNEGETKKLAFAYEIGKVSSGYFGYLHAELTPKAAKAIEEEVRLKKNILRLLVLRLDPVSETKKAKTSKRAAKKKEDARPLTNEELEKKIEELSAKV